MSRTTVRSVAACVVAAALVGTLTQAVLARGWTPRDTGAGVSQVDADPTPTPSPTTPEPTPTPELTPTPTPIATPTPFDESEASITALATIDDDGDLTTVEDRHTLDSEWDFSGDFGSAEVVFANPTSIGSEPASWFIDYEGFTRVVITDLGRDGFTLIDIECVAQSDSREWEVDGSSAIWFPPVPAAGPSRFDCEFIHFADVGGSIELVKFVDPDADAGTDNSVYASSPFEFSIDVDNAEVFSEGPRSVDGNPATWGILFTGPSTNVFITEVPRDGFRLDSASCFDVGIFEKFVPVAIVGNTLSFEAHAPAVNSTGHYACNVVNVRTGDAPEVTLPPTDVGGEMPHGSGTWPALLVLVLAGAVALLVLTVPRTTRRRDR